MDASIDKRIELFRKVVAETLKEINGAVVEDASDLEKLIGAVSVFIIICSAHVH
jgi:hypothetical protein